MIRSSLVSNFSALLIVTLVGCANPTDEKSKARRVASGDNSGCYPNLPLDLKPLAYESNYSTACVNNGLDSIMLVIGQKSESYLIQGDKLVSESGQKSELSIKIFPASAKSYDEIEYLILDEKGVKTIGRKHSAYNKQAPKAFEANAVFSAPISFIYADQKLEWTVQFEVAVVQCKNSASDAFLDLRPIKVVKGSGEIRNEQDSSKILSHEKGEIWFPSARPYMFGPYHWLGYNNYSWGKLNVTSGNADCKTYSNKDLSLYSRDNGGAAESAPGFSIEVCGGKVKAISSNDKPIQELTARQNVKDTVECVGSSYSGRYLVPGN